MNTFRYRIRTLYQYKDLIKELVSRDIKLKYRRSFLGYVWSVLNPLLIMIVMTVVFSAMFDRNIENYPVYLLIGRSLYDFMTASTNGAMGSVTGNASLLKKTYIPKYIFHPFQGDQLPGGLCVLSGCFTDRDDCYQITFSRGNAAAAPHYSADLHFLLRPGLSAGTVPCVFPGYPVYL